MITRAIHSSQVPYVCVSRSAIEDPRLSLSAKGLLMVALNHPNDWNLTVAEVAAHGIDGLCAVRAALNELITCGYVLRRQVNGIRGQLHWLSTVIEAPNRENRGSVGAEEESVLPPTSGNRTSVKDDETTEAPPTCDNRDSVEPLSVQPPFDNRTSVEPPPFDNRTSVEPPPFDNRTSVEPPPFDNRTSVTPVRDDTMSPLTPPALTRTRTRLDPDPDLEGGDLPSLPPSFLGEGVGEGNSQTEKTSAIAKLAEQLLLAAGLGPLKAREVAGNFDFDRIRKIVGMWYDERDQGRKLFNKKTNRTELIGEGILYHWLTDGRKAKPLSSTFRHSDLYRDHRLPEELAEEARIEAEIEAMASLGTDRPGLVAEVFAASDTLHSLPAIIARAKDFVPHAKNALLSQVGGDFVDITPRGKLVAATEDDVALWQRCLAEIETTFPDAAFKAWVKDVKLVNIHGNCVTLGVPNKFALAWLESRAKHVIKRTLSSMRHQATNIHFVALEGEPNSV